MTINPFSQEGKDLILKTDDLFQNDKRFTLDQKARGTITVLKKVKPFNERFFVATGVAEIYHPDGRLEQNETYPIIVNFRGEIV